MFAFTNSNLYRYTSYDSVRGRVFAAVDDIIAHTLPAGNAGSSDDEGGAEGADAESDTWHVFVTGHSLGGALATLFSAELGESVKSGRRDCTVTMYNYGSPRVGRVALTPG
jgi:pimeloyl-ACP methyl ester carboxylesterase